MKRTLNAGKVARLYYGAFKVGTEEQLVRWDMRRDKVISTARGLMRANPELKIQIRGQWFVSPAKEDAA